MELPEQNAAADKVAAPANSKPDQSLKIDAARALRLHKRKAHRRKLRASHTDG